ncbi:hypothetical protein BS47DRAFT_1397506 [Hydnum rufescens UP504]|uniref:Uncharacterized protein n=1 Tax=Hydnum rufescens UP504 TaxID=1448309 RepID=A0A9P6AN72_9AGAM|nr:hypothetical protein BS47DRAFT_1397506 [Hydnum rufescens UP504]
MSPFYEWFPQVSHTGSMMNPTLHAHHNLEPRDFIPFSPATPDILLIPPNTRLPRWTSPPVELLYGDPSQDTGDEVRFRTQSLVCALILPCFIAPYFFASLSMNSTNGFVAVTDGQPHTSHQRSSIHRPLHAHSTLIYSVVRIATLLPSFSICRASTRALTTSDVFSPKARDC